MVEEEKTTMESTETAPKKSHKKAIIITSVVAAGAVAVGASVPAILSMKKGAEQQYLKENPTKYLANSVVKYFDEQEKDNGAYNFAKNIYKAGGIKFNYNMQGTEISGTNTMFEGIPVGPRKAGDDILIRSALAIPP